MGMHGCVVAICVSDVAYTPSVPDADKLWDGQRETCMIELYNS